MCSYNALFCVSHIPVLTAQLVPDDPTTIVFTDSDTEVTVTIPASALLHQRSIDTEGEHLTLAHSIVVARYNI